LIKTFYPKKYFHDFMVVWNFFLLFLNKAFK